MLNARGNTGHCTVSPWCSLPHLFHGQVILPCINNTGIYCNTVVKRVRKNGSSRRIIELDAIERTSRPEKQRCRFLSEELPDWYSENDSAWSRKTQLTFTHFSFIIEGSSCGEVLVLSNASYLQDLMEQFDSDVSGIGKTMAQTFLVNSAVRLHPVEFSIGQTAGVENHLKNISQILAEEHLRRFRIDC